MTFGSVALNLPTKRNVQLLNTGPNNAMFHVLNTSPIPDMAITPAYGIVPVGGSAELQVCGRLVWKTGFLTHVCVRLILHSLFAAVVSGRPAPAV